jgi:hypothetical protein
LRATFAAHFCRYRLFEAGNPVARIKCSRPQGLRWADCFSNALGTYHRVGDAAKLAGDSSDKDWERRVTFEDVRSISVMHQLMLDQRQH